MLGPTEWMLILVCFFGSLISVSIGTSCGILLAAMVTVLPPSVAIPLHGLTEGLSSGIRWIVLRQHVNYRYLLYFSMGCMAGLCLGWPLLDKFPDSTLKLILGLFLLITLWVPLSWLRLPASAGGAITSCLTVLVGATGPLVAALLARNQQSHRTVIATQGACTLFQHWGKVLVFNIAGYSFSHYWQLAIALCVTTIVGTVCGKSLLSLIPAQYLKLALRYIVSLLGLHLVIGELDVTLGNPSIVSPAGVVVLLALALCSGYAGYQLGYRKKTSQ